VEEASNFRNELKMLVKHDESRLEKKKNELIKNLNNKLEKDEKIELKKKKATEFYLKNISLLLKKIKLLMF